MQVIPILKILDLKLKKKIFYIAILFRRVLKSISLAEVRPLNIRDIYTENIGGGGVYLILPFLKLYINVK